MEACHLFDDMEAQGLKPTVVTYNALIGNLGKAGKLREAAMIFHGMKVMGCMPDGVTLKIMKNLMSLQAK
jgi:pentatricopeptide repeat protein